MTQGEFNDGNQCGLIITAHNIDRQALEGTAICPQLTM